MKARLRAIFAHFGAQLILVFVAAVAVRLVALWAGDPGLYADSTRRVFYALEWLENPFLFIPGVPWPPLQIPLVALALMIYPDPLLAPVLLNVFLGGLAVLPLGYLVRRQFGQTEVGVLAAVIYAFYPLAIRYTLVAQPEVLYVTFVYFGLWFLFLARDEPRRGRSYAHVTLGALSMAVAAWLHLPPWFLIPVFGLLLWGRWPQLALYAVVAVHPIVLWLLQFYTRFGYMMPSAVTGGQHVAVDPKLPSDLGDYLRLVGYYPNLLVQTLSAAFIVLGVLGALKAFQAPRAELVRRTFPLMSLAVLLVPYLYFEFLWNRMMPKELILLAALAVPYSALGLHAVTGLLSRRWERALIVAAVLGLMLVGPYLGIFTNYWELVPAQRAPTESVRLVDWFAESVDSGEAILFDHFDNWQEYYPPIALRKGPGTAFMNPNGTAPIPLEDLDSFLDTARPTYLVLSKTESSWLMPLLEFRCESVGCPDRVRAAYVDVELEKVYESNGFVIYKRVQPG